MYKEASKQKLRIATVQGNLAVEQLWDLPLTQLDTLAVSLEKEYKDSGKKSFLAARSKKDKELKLKFNIVLDILQTKVDESNSAKDELDRKEHNQKVMALIAEKRDEELKGKSVKELKELLK